MPGMGLLIIGAGSERDPKYRCLCCPEQVVFYEGEERAYEQHVVACARRHDEGLRAQSLRVKVPGIFDPFVSGDVEFGVWVRANRRALIEGRLKM